MKKAVQIVVLSLFLLTLPLPVAAEDAQTQGQYEDFLQNVPPEISEFFPGDLSAAELEKSAESLRKNAGIGAVLSTVGRLTGLAIRENLGLLAKICGLLLFGAVFRALSPENEDTLGKAFSFCVTLATTVLLFSFHRTDFSRLERFFDTVRTLCAAFVPLMGTLYAMGGNVRTAAVNHSVFSAFLSVLEIFCAGSVLPIAGICLAFAMLDALVGRGNLRGLAALIKRTYALSLSFLMGIFCFVLSTQSTLAGAGDTLALRTARFAAGNFLPLLGGSISETLRTVAGSVQYLRGVVGTGTILALFFLFLPLFISILLTRITLLLGSAVAGFLNCDAQGKLLAELAAVYGYFLAILAAVFVMIIFSLTLFTRCAAVG